MPTLDWIGKKAVLNHHREVPFHLLKEVPELSAGDPAAGNLLVQGDNLLALKALLPYYAGQVKCVYIDPPYNTGKEGWIYNDAVNSPEMRAWLGRVVGPEGEDLSRHDKWLCMMYPRLMLLREFLAEDGVIFISIGKDETGHLRVLCDEVFGAKCHLETFIWQMDGNVENQEAVTATHEYVLAYERKAKQSSINPTVDLNVDDDSKLLRDFAENSVIKNGAGNPASIIVLPVGFPCVVDQLELARHEFGGELIAAVAGDEGYIKRELRGRFGAEYPIRIDDLVVEGGVLVRPCRVYSGWSSARKLARFIETGCVPLIEDDGSRLSFFLSGTGVPIYRREGRVAHFVPTMIRNVGTTERASNELERMGVRFAYPKPVGLVEYLFSLYATPGALVMDSFAGSGTTGHAVLKLNAERELSLRCILIEIDPGIARTIATPRIRAVSKGYSARRGTRTEAVAGIGGGFRFCELAAPLFSELGTVRPDVTFAELAAHVYFVATGVPLPPGKAKQTPLLGVHQGQAIYLLFNGVLGDKRPDGGNILTSAVLDALPKHHGPKLIYGEGCRLGEARLKREQVTFRQIPYDLQVNG